MPMQAQFLNRLVHSAHRAAENAAERNVENKVEEGVNKAFEERDDDDDDRQQQEQQQKQKADSKKDTWKCPACGHKGNTGKFCAECGAKKPEPNDGTWTCPACGTKGNTGKFCNECGAKKPEAGASNQQAAAGNNQQAAQAPEKKAAESAYAKSDFVPGDEIMFEDDVVGEQMGEFPSKWDLIGGNAEIASVDGENRHQPHRRLHGDRAADERSEELPHRGVYARI